MNPCEGCPILCSCTRKYEHPKTCSHKPAYIGTNLSGDFANYGRRKIAIIEAAMPRKNIIGELRLRIEVCGGCP